MSRSRRCRVICVALTTIGCALVLSQVPGMAATIGPGPPPPGKGNFILREKGSVVNPERTLTVFSLVKAHHGEVFGGQGVGGGGGGRGYSVESPGKYRLRYYQQRCEHCFTIHPKPVGEKFGRCSHRLRIKAGKRTFALIHRHGNKPCVIHVRPPHRPR
jgi:hypothetical protein